jgi:hypothetical protein
MNHDSKAATSSSSAARSTAVSEKALDQAAPSRAAFPASATSPSPVLAVSWSAWAAIRSGKVGMSASRRRVSECGGARLEGSGRGYFDSDLGRERGRS